MNASFKILPPLKLIMIRGFVILIVVEITVAAIGIIMATAYSNAAVNMLNRSLMVNATVITLKPFQSLTITVDPGELLALYINKTCVRNTAGTPINNSIVELDGLTVIEDKYPIPASITVTNLCWPQVHDVAEVKYATTTNLEIIIKYNNLMNESNTWVNIVMLSAIIWMVPAAIVMLMPKDGN